MTKKLKEEIISNLDDYINFLNICKLAAEAGQPDWKILAEISDTRFKIYKMLERLDVVFDLFRDGKLSKMPIWKVHFKSDFLLIDLRLKNLHETYPLPGYKDHNIHDKVKHLLISDK